MVVSSSPPNFSVTARPLRKTAAARTEEEPPHIFDTGGDGAAAPGFSAIARLLRKSAAVRTEDELRQIVDALDPALRAADVVWAAARVKVVVRVVFWCLQND